MFGHNIFRAACLALQRPVAHALGKSGEANSGTSGDLKAVAKHMTLAAAHAGLGAKAVLRAAFAPRMATALVLGGGGAAALLVQNHDEEQWDGELGSVAWVQEIAQTPGMQQEWYPSAMLRQHFVGKILSDEDHLFGALIQTGQIQGFRCFFHPEARKFFSVVQLGMDVCGYPQTVHGGLTAAIVDETLGGLSTCLWKSGVLGLQLPAFTARLEVDYKQKIPAGQTLLCVTEVESIEGRKVWMRATVSDGSGTTFATGRALFIAPSMLPKWMRNKQQAPAQAQTLPSM